MAKKIAIHTIPRNAAELPNMIHWTASGDRRDIAMCAGTA
jgi:hypothetical protein